MAPMVQRNMSVWPYAILIRELLKMPVHGANLPLASRSWQQSKVLLGSWTSKIRFFPQDLGLSRAPTGSTGCLFSGPGVGGRFGVFTIGLYNPWNCWPFSCQFKVKWRWQRMVWSPFKESTKFAASRLSPWKSASLWLRKPFNNHRAKHRSNVPRLCEAFSGFSRHVGELSDFPYHHIHAFYRTYLSGV